MTEVRNTDAPMICLNCKSRNVIGPYKYLDSGIRVSGMLPVRQQAFVCVDCGYTMLFTRKEHEGKILRELLEKQEKHSGK